MKMFVAIAFLLVLAISADRLGQIKRELEALRRVLESIERNTR